MVCEELEQRVRQANQEHTGVEAIYAPPAARAVQKGTFVSPALQKRSLYPLRLVQGGLQECWCTDQR